MIAVDRAPLFVFSGGFMPRNSPLHVFANFESSLTVSTSKLSRSRTVLWVCAALLGASLASAQDYGVLRIPTLGGKLTRAFSVNDAAQVVGTSEIADRSSHAFIWRRGTHLQDLGTLGGPTSVAYAINAVGQIAGTADDIYDNNRPFLWSAATGMKDLGTLGGVYGGGGGLNSHGEVVGSATPNDFFNDVNAFRWTEASGMVDLGTIGVNSGASAINDNGDAVGYSSVADGSVHAFLWTAAGGVEDLGTLGGLTCYPAAINNSGQVVGYSNTVSGTDHAFFWTSATGMLDLGAPAGYTNSLLWGILPSGKAVGSAWAAGVKGVPVIWTRSGGFKILGPFAKTGISSADAINAAGTILASRYGGAGYSSFLLSPVMHATLVSSSNPSVLGQSVTFTVTVKSPVQGPPPNGEIAIFRDGTKALARVALVRGVSKFTTTALAAGTHAFQVTYPGDLNYALSKSAVLEQVVNTP